MFSPEGVDGVAGETVPPVGMAGLAGETVPVGVDG